MGTELGIATGSWIHLLNSTALAHGNSPAEVLHSAEMHALPAVSLQILLSLCFKKPLALRYWDPNIPHFTIVAGLFCWSTASNRKARAPHIPRILVEWVKVWKKTTDMLLNDSDRRISLLIHEDSGVNCSPKTSAKLLLHWDNLDLKKRPPSHLPLKGFKQKSPVQVCHYQSLSSSATGGGHRSKLRDVLILHFRIAWLLAWKAMQ